MVHLLADSGGSGDGRVLELLLLGLYFLPAIIAAIRRSRANPVFVVNLFLGWTFIGWVVALAMAVSSVRLAPSAPRGWFPASCPRCNATNNVPAGEHSFECWQCKYVGERQ